MAAIAVGNLATAEGRALELRSPERVARAFAAAQRHSRFVMRMRRFIPLAGIVALVLLVIAPYLNPFKSISGLSIGPISLSGSRVTMENPKLSGFRKDGKPYELVAKSATQDIRKPNEIDLFEMDAHVQMEANGWATLKAATGHFDSQKERMQLKGGVTVRNDTGYDIKLKTADIDFKAGTVRSQEPVKVETNGTTIDADTLDVTDNGKIISFVGRVRAVFENSGAQIGPSAASGAPRSTGDAQ